MMLYFRNIITKNVYAFDEVSHAGFIRNLYFDDFCSNGQRLEPEWRGVDPDDLTDSDRIITMGNDGRLQTLREGGGS
jgi:hypothetical protein